MHPYKHIQHGIRTDICTGLAPVFTNLRRTVFGSSKVRRIPKSNISTGE